MKITKNTTISEILKIPGAETVLIKYNLPCLSCPMAKFEIENLEIGDVANIYNLNLKEILKELNKLITPT
ncbi:MAG: disulfide oxidoreductase [Candidatus Pacebacteria bacterium]|nr:disulfide oxidoreductase [Candidatus Paceibacterota bacterium]